MAKFCLVSLRSKFVAWCRCQLVHDHPAFVKNSWKNSWKLGVTVLSRFKKWCWS